MTVGVQADASLLAAVLTLFSFCHLHVGAVAPAPSPPGLPPRTPSPIPPSYVPFPPAPPHATVTGQARLLGGLGHAAGFVTVAPAYGGEAPPLSYFLDLADATNITSSSTPGSSSSSTSSSSYTATTLDSSTLLFRSSPDGVFLLPSTTSHALITLPPSSLTLDPLTSLPLPFSLHTSIIPAPDTGTPPAYVVAHPLGFIASLKMAYNGLVPDLAPYASYSEALEASFRQVMGAPWGLTASSSSGSNSSSSGTSQYLMATVAGAPLQLVGAGGPASSPLTRVAGVGLLYADALVAATLGVGANLAARVAAAAPRAPGDPPSPCAAGMSGWQDGAPVGTRARAGVDFAARRLGEWLWANSSDAPDLGRSGRVAEALLQVMVIDCHVVNSSALVSQANRVAVALRRTSGRLRTSWVALRGVAVVRGPRACGLDVLRQVAWGLKQVGLALHPGRGVLANATAPSFVAGTSSGALWGVASPYEPLDTWSLLNTTALLAALGIPLGDAILPPNPLLTPPPPVPAPPPLNHSAPPAQLAGGSSSNISSSSSSSAGASSTAPLGPPALRVVLMGAGRITGCKAGAWVNILESEQVTGLGTDAAGVVSPLPLRPSYAHVVFSLGGGAAGSGCVDAYTKLEPLGWEVADWVVPLPTSSYTPASPRVVVLDALGLLAASIAENSWCPADGGAAGSGGGANLGLVTPAAWAAAWCCLGAPASTLGSGVDLVGRGWGDMALGDDVPGGGSHPLTVAALAAGAQVAVVVGAAAAVLQGVMGSSRGDAADAVLRRFASTVCTSPAGLAASDGGVQLGLLYTGMWSDWHGLTAGMEASGGLAGIAAGPELPLVQDPLDPVASSSGHHRRLQQGSSQPSPFKGTKPGDAPGQLGHETPAAAPRVPKMATPGAPLQLPLPLMQLVGLGRAAQTSVSEERQPLIGAPTASSRQRGCSRGAAADSAGEEAVDAAAAANSGLVGGDWGQECGGAGDESEGVVETLPQANGAAPGLGATQWDEFKETGRMSRQSTLSPAGSGSAASQGAANFHSTTSSQHRHLAQVPARVDLNAARALMQAAGYAASNLTALLQAPKAAALSAAAGGASAAGFDPLNATVYASRVAVVAQGSLLSNLSALASRVAAGADYVEMGGPLAELASSFRGASLAAAVATAMVDLSAISADLSLPPEPPSPLPPAPPAPPPKGSDWTTRKIIAIAVGVSGAAAVLLVLLAIVICVLRRKRAAVRAAEAINSPWNDARLQAQSYPTHAMYERAGPYSGKIAWGEVTETGNGQYHGSPAGYSTPPRYANATAGTPAIATLGHASGLQRTNAASLTVLAVATDNTPVETLSGMPGHIQ